MTYMEYLVGLISLIRITAYHMDRICRAWAPEKGVFCPRRNCGIGSQLSSDFAIENMSLRYSASSLAPFTLPSFVLSSPAYATLLPIALGSIVGITVSRPPTQHNRSQGQYESLKRPPGHPAGWLFGPIWTTIYAMMGYASYRVFSAGMSSAVPTARQAASVMVPCPKRSFFSDTLTVASLARCNAIWHLPRPQSHLDASLLQSQPSPTCPGGYTFPLGERWCDNKVLFQGGQGGWVHDGPIYGMVGLCNLYLCGSGIYEWLGCPQEGMKVSHDKLNTSNDFQKKKFASRGVDIA